MCFAKSCTHRRIHGSHDDIRPYFTEKGRYFIEKTAKMQKNAKNIWIIPKYIVSLHCIHGICENPEML